MKKLHLSDKDKIIAGVCGGLAESIGIKANILRLIFVISLFFGFSGGWLYLILFIVLPGKIDEPEIIDVETEEDKHKIKRCWKKRMIAGVCCGIANYLGWDVSLVRIAFVVMSFVAGVGIALYMALYMIFWFLFPNEE
jgi:phage shock protein PspC (stress-responsive transcriptional regulator)